MADADKNILITTSTGTASEPTIVFTGGNNNPVTLRTLDDGTLAIEGSSGQLFSISDDLTGTVFSANDSAGVPVIEVDASGVVHLAEVAGSVKTSASNKVGVYDSTGALLYSLLKVY